MKLTVARLLWLLPLSHLLPPSLLSHIPLARVRAHTHRYIRSKTLFMRWAELSSLTPFFRTHPGSLPEANWQFDSDKETLEHFFRMVKVFRAWAFYRDSLMRDAQQNGWPVVRHLLLEFPNNSAITREDLRCDDSGCLPQPSLRAPSPSLITPHSSSLAPHFPPSLPTLTSHPHSSPSLLTLTPAVSSTCLGVRCWWLHSTVSLSLPSTLECSCPADWTGCTSGPM